MITVIPLGVNVAAGIVTCDRCGREEVARIWEMTPLQWVLPVGWGHVLDGLTQRDICPDCRQEGERQ